MKESLLKSSKLKFMNRDVLKYIALIVMFIGHFVLYTFSSDGFHYPISITKACFDWVLIAPPIFMFFVAEGYHYTRSKEKYATRLLIFAFATQIPMYLCYETPFTLKDMLFSWNVLFSLFFGLLCLIIWNKKWHVVPRVILMIACVALTVLIQSEWMGFGPLIIILFYFLREKPMWRFVAYIITMFLFHLSMASLTTWQAVLSTIIPILLITFFYNGKKGSDSKFNKYFFYIFYPGHLLLIYIVKILVATIAG